MLKFLGIGSAFNSELGNNSAFLKVDKSLLLIDSGGEIFHKIKRIGLFEEVENIYVVITHFHLDHFGSLGDIIFYFYYILKKKVNVIYPKGDDISALLKELGVEKELYNLFSEKEFLLNDDYIKNLKISFLEVSHVENMDSFGFLMNYNGKNIYYSGDSNNIDENIIRKLELGELDIIHQDCSVLDFEGAPHLSINKLDKLIKKELREKVYVMHLDRKISVEEIIKRGYKISELYKK